MREAPWTLAVAGKGGTGKTTVAALLVEELRGCGPVLAVDADPNCNLGEALGIPVRRTIGQMRDEILEKLGDLPPGVSKEQLLELGLHECLVEDEGVDLLAMGHGEGPRCYCMVNHVLRRCVEILRRNYRYVVLDNEAGMEHLSRRTTQDVDVLLIVAEPNPVSLRSARRISQIVEDLKLRVSRTFLVLNKAGEDFSGDVGIPVLGRIPYDPEVERLWAGGRPLRELSPFSPARLAVKKLLEKLQQRRHDACP
ncbi:MAG: AAA family ATPase [Candidatus Bipolaricaulaceae bacterium]